MKRNVSTRIGGGYDRTKPTYPLRSLNSRQLQAALGFGIDSRISYIRAIQHAERFAEILAPIGSERIDGIRYSQIITQLDDMLRHNIAGTPKDTVRIDPLALRLKTLIDELRLPTAVIEHAIDELTALMAERGRISVLELSAED